MKKLCKAAKILCVFIALVTVFTFTGCASMTNPAYYLDDSIEKTTDDLFDFDIANILSDALKKGSISLGVSSNGDTLPFENLNATLYFNEDKSTVVSQMTAKIDGESLDASAYMSPESYIFESDSILGDKAYGINVEKFAKNYPDSIFDDENSDYYLEIDDDDYDALIDFLDKYAEIAKTTDELKDIKEKYETTLKKAIKKYAETDRYKEDGITYVVMEFDNESIASIVEVLIEEFKDDEEFEEIILKYLNLFDITGESYESEYKNFIDDDLDDIPDNIKNGVEFNIDVKVGTKNKIIKNANIEVEYNNVDVLTITADVEDDEETYVLKLPYVEYTLIYDKLENSRSSYSSKITLKEKLYDESATTLFKAKIQWDKKSDDLEIDMDINDNTDYLYNESTEFINIKVKGTLNVKSNSFTLSVNEVKYNDQVFDDMTVTFSANAKDSMPSAPDYTDLLLMKEDEFTELMEKIEDELDGTFDFETADTTSY